MKKKLVLVGFLIVTVLFSTAFKFDANSKLIQVSGAGVVSFEPNIAYVSVGVSGVFQDVSKGQKEINESINLFLGKIKDIVVADNISTERFSINHNYEYISGKRQFVGYNIEQQLKIKVEDLKLLGKILDLAVNSGLNNIGQIDFSSARLDEYKQQALKLALLDAKKKAELMASTMETGKIRLKHISEAGASIQPLRNDGFQVKALAMSDSSTQYQVGDMKVMANVNVTYEF